MDSYVQRQGSFQYLNTKSGKMETWNMSDGSENHANEIALISPVSYTHLTGNIAYAVSSFCPNSLKEETAYAILPVAMADSDGVIKSVRCV